MAPFGNPRRTRESLVGAKRYDHLGFGTVVKRRAEALGEARSRTTRFAGGSTGRARRPTRSSTKTTTSSRFAITSTSSKAEWWEIHVVIIPKKWIPTLLDLGLGDAQHLEPARRRHSKGRSQDESLRERLHDSHGGAAAVPAHRTRAHPHSLGQTHVAGRRRSACPMSADAERPPPYPRTALASLSVALAFAAISSTSFGGGQKASIRRQVVVARLDGPGSLHGRARTGAGVCRARTFSTSPSIAAKKPAGCPARSRLSWARAFRRSSSS